MFIIILLVLLVGKMPFSGKLKLSFRGSSGMGQTYDVDGDDIDDDINITIVGDNTAIPPEYQEGLDMLLINKLGNEKNAEYVRELLTLYSNSSVPLKVLLNIHATEAGYYPGTKILESYIPMNNGVVDWGEKDENGKVMTLENIDSSYLGTKEIPASGSNSIDTKANGQTAYDVNVFQIRTTHFPDKEDPYKVADQIKYMERSWVSPNLKGLKEPEYKLYANGAVHNGGSGTLTNRLTYGSRFGRTLVTDPVDRDKTANNFFKSIKELQEGLSSKGFGYNVIAGRGANRMYIYLGMLEEHDFHTVNGTFSKMYNDGMIGSKASIMDRYNKYAKKTNGVPEYTGKTSEIINYLEGRYGVNPADVIPGDLTPYTTITSSAATSYLFRVTDLKTDDYKGYTDKKIVQAMMVITAEYMLLANGDGEKVYANMLYAGGLTNVDPNKPETYTSLGGSKFNPDTSKIVTPNGDPVAPTQKVLASNNPRSNSDEYVYPINSNNTLTLTKAFADTALPGESVSMGDVMASKYNTDSMSETSKSSAIGLKSRDVNTGYSVYLKTSVPSGKKSLKYGDIIYNTRVTDIVGDYGVNSEFSGSGYGPFRVKNANNSSYFLQGSGKVSFPGELNNLSTRSMNSAGIVGLNPKNSQARDWHRAIDFSVGKGKGIYAVMDGKYFGVKEEPAFMSYLTGMGIGANAEQEIRGSFYNTMSAAIVNKSHGYIWVAIYSHHEQEQIPGGKVTQNQLIGTSSNIAPSAMRVHLDFQFIQLKENSDFIHRYSLGDLWDINYTWEGGN